MVAAVERLTEISAGLPQLPDEDPAETQEWLESLDGLVDHAGRTRARALLLRVLQRARERQVDVPSVFTTDYVNTIAPGSEPEFPGDESIERRLRAYSRWNAAVMVHRAQRPDIGVGGHISTYASAAALYEVGFNHFFRGHDADGGGDQIFFQGHASPGIYARAFLEGRLSELQLDGFRQELSHGGLGGGLPSYPHPRLMPGFWEFPTVSMGLGPLNAIYQARFNRYLQNRGIRDTGSVASWTAAGTSYATHGEPMIPVYIFYSMFGFQRTGDGLWAAADRMTRGFLLGATAGRTTLNGEGLQHQDGHSPLLASTNPACVAYAAAYAFELGHIVRDGLRRMYGVPRPGEDPNVFYYLTLYNEPIAQPAEPDDVDVDGILAGMHRLSPADRGSGPRAQLLASGIAVPWALDAQRLLQTDWGVHADVWSVTSWTELRRQALAADGWNRAHPEQPPRSPYVTQRLSDAPGPVVAVSDWMRAVPDQIAPFVPGDWSSLGTDGFGRSDTRPALRRHFGIDAPSIVLRTLEQLIARHELDSSARDKAVEAYQLEVAAGPTASTAGCSAR